MLLKTAIIRLVLTEIQAFKNEKKYKEMYGNADKSGLLSGFVRISIHFFVNFFVFKCLYLSQN